MARYSRVMCRQSDIELQRTLFTIPVGSMLLGQFRSRPCVFVTEKSILDWLSDEVDPPSISPGGAVAYTFATEEGRAAHLRTKGWDRLSDGYLREEMWELYRRTAPGEADRGAFETAYIDALDAIRELPCKQCRAVAWPTITKPAPGSAEWWDDPSAEFSCRRCGRYLADPFAYPAIRVSTTDYPYEGVVDRTRLPAS